MALPRTVELQWQEEMICRWLSIAGLPDDARSGLVEMLTNVQNEMDKLRTDLLQRQAEPLAKTI